jgi:predicted nucleic acid-binding protein
MAPQSVKLAGKQFLLVPKTEYAQLKERAGQARLRRGRARNGKGGPKLPPVEVYSDRRVAEFLLSNSVNAADYGRACDEVRKMGLDPGRIPHQKPPGAA